MSYRISTIAKGLLMACTLTLATGSVFAGEKPAHIKVFAPSKGDVAGVGSKAFIVDLRVEFEGDLAATGVTPELTGPGPLANAGPFPGDFSPGADPSFPGLVVLLSSSTVGAGPGQNLANLFNVVGITDRSEDETYIWATWIIGKENLFGSVGEVVPSRLFVAVVDGMAPDWVEDMDGNGKLNKKDLKAMGYDIISNTRKVNFFVNGN